MNQDENQIDPGDSDNPSSRDSQSADDHLNVSSSLSLRLQSLERRIQHLEKVIQRQIRLGRMVE